MDAKQQYKSAYQAVRFYWRLPYYEKKHDRFPLMDSGYATIPVYILAAAQQSYNNRSK